MKCVLVLGFCLLLLAVATTFATAQSPKQDPKQVKCAYEAQRDDLISAEKKRRLSQSLVLTPEERTVNNYMHQLKQSEFVQGEKRLNTTRHFLAAHNFARMGKDKFEATLVFKALQSLPKGALLHIHHSSMGDIKDAVQFVFDTPELLKKFYVLVCGEAAQQLSDPSAIFATGFSDTPTLPAKGSCAANRDDCRWVLASNFTVDEISTVLTLVSKDVPTGQYEAQDVWPKFQDMFSRMGGLLSYRPVCEHYVYKALSNLVDNGITHVELRSNPVGVYESYDGPASPYNDCGKMTYGLDFGVEFLHNISLRVQAERPQFNGIKIIYSIYRVDSREQMVDALLKVEEMMAKYPDLVVGFDMVGEEDKGLSLEDYEPELSLDPATFYFHSGETVLPDDLYSSRISRAQDPVPTSYNLFDAVMHKSKRIGHGLSLIHHPELMGMVKDNGICIETCPLSNQVLGYVEDMRDHPASVFMANGLKLSLSSDDPAIFGYNGMTYDFYAAYTSWGLSLADIKQLILTSFDCAALTDKERVTLLANFQKQWRWSMDRLKKEACQSTQKPGWITLQGESVPFLCPTSNTDSVDRTCGSLAGHTSILYTNAEWNLNFCDSIDCTFSSGNSTVVTEGEVLSPCQVQCKSPAWPAPETVTVNLVQNKSKALCASRECSKFTFYKF